MNKFMLIAGLSVLSSTAFAEWVNGYTRQNGTYVSGYNRSDPRVARLTALLA